MPAVLARMFMGFGTLGGCWDSPAPARAAVCCRSGITALRKLRFSICAAANWILVLDKLIDKSEPLRLSDPSDTISTTGRSSLGIRGAIPYVSRRITAEFEEFLHARDHRRELVRRYCF